MARVEWSDAEFRARVEHHATRQGLVLSEVLRRAELGTAYFQKPPKDGRNIGGVLKIADVLDVDPIELLGLRNGTRSLVQPHSKDIDHLALVGGLIMHICLTVNKLQQKPSSKEIQSILKSLMHMLGNATETAKQDHQTKPD